MSTDAQALRMIADQMEDAESYRTDEMGVEALCLRNAADRIEQLEAENKSVMENIPMSYLQRHDVSGATGPTKALNLRAAMRDYSEDRWKTADRIKKLEAALRHVGDCLYIDDYGDYGLLSNFDAEKINTALEGKKDD